MGLLLTLVSDNEKMLSLLTALSKLEWLTRTCHGEKRHVAGQNVTDDEEIRELMLKVK